jgi:hypothetical protein
MSGCGTSGDMGQGTGNPSSFSNPDFSTAWNMCFEREIEDLPVGIGASSLTVGGLGGVQDVGSRMKLLKTQNWDKRVLIVNSSF